MVMKGLASAPMSTYENIMVEGGEGVVRIIINRPKVLNALNRATVVELGDAIDRLDRDVRVVLLTGSGDRAFVAGADISEMMSLSAEDAAAFSRVGHDVFQKLEALDAPVIAEVNGYALGGGCELMLACDFAIASETARFGQPEVGLGVTPGFGGTVRLARRIGNGRARQLLFTGDQLSADEALRYGLVNEVVAPLELRARGDALAARIVKNAPRAVALAKRSGRRAEESDFATACLFEQQIFGLCFSTKDQKEGMGAFLEKRSPHWLGK